MHQTKTRFVLFDAGGTLVGTNTDSEYWYEQFFVDVCAEQGCKVTISQVHNVLKQAARTSKFISRCSSDSEARAFWQHIYSTAFADLLGARAMQQHTPAFIEHLAAEYIDRFEAGEYIRLFPDALATLETLKSRDVKMGIVSNFSSHLHTFLEQLNIKHFFEFVIVSAEEGCEKPNPVIFNRAIERCLPVKKDNLLYVGDTPEDDYVPAEKCGLGALLIDRHNRYSDRENITRINSLQQLENYI